MGETAIRSEEGLRLIWRCFDMPGRMVTVPAEIAKTKKTRLPGLGHRVHSEDPRKDILFNMARECGLKLPQSEVTREICRALKPRRYKLDEYGK